ncbi:hypothetical protein BJ684DRAFT_14826 [Piptocephalis cylindrospora]|uniref:Uncharacterized protein n=1 Tax=Piptocephalis cylindrospora TaxID=1907219 RepID=A0A4P9Y7X2_9FUNG|nr:hypothetical protein BJ684DRAFT_14826 [Piptocephalis cylindrospora]|eukprot:RKP14882.1 hypothetical protein BJ684DRAFT_14826 [Piptocephalis cylindrospora]
MPHHQAQQHQESSSNTQGQDGLMAGRQPATMVGGMRVGTVRKPGVTSLEAEEQHRQQNSKTTDMDPEDLFLVEEERLKKKDELHEIQRRTSIDKAAAIRDQQRAEAQRERHPPPNDIRTQDNMPIRQPSFRH